MLPSLLWPDTAQAVNPALGPGCGHSGVRWQLGDSQGSWGTRHCTAMGELCFGNGLQRGKGCFGIPTAAAADSRRILSPAPWTAQPKRPSRGHTTAAAEGNKKDQERGPVLSLCSTFLEEDLAPLGLLPPPRPWAAAGQPQG